ncbi:MAG: molybdenum cofactor guanylyltransferase [Candidatus Bathyarchaeia archaeon]|jgi:molybdopterin-guanine dinucleotide biosynthesis protein A
MTKRAALILAGGKGRRFQSRGKKWQDKALAKLSGKPLLIHAVENVQGVVDEIAISVNDEERKAKYAQILKKYAQTDIKIVIDEKNNHVSGPTVAIMSGLKSVQSDYCLTLPCDMPFLQPAVADYLFNEAEGFQVVIPMWPNGRLETLIMVLERHSGLEITDTLCKLKRPRSDDIPRGASKILFASPVNHIKTLDPELKSFININFKEDLNQLQTRRSHGPVTEDLKVNLGVLSISDLQLLREGAEMFQGGKLSEAQSRFASCTSNFEVSNNFFWAAVSGENQGEALLKLSQQQLDPKAATELDFEGKEAFLRAANNYRIEAEIHEENRCILLAERALADKSWCESWVMGKHSHVHRYPPKVT